MKDKFIEYDLPLEEISEHAAHEKNIHVGLPPQFHVWWARRPLSSSRSTALAALVNDPGPESTEERNSLFNLIADIAPWEAVKNGPSKEIIEAQGKIENEYNDRPKVIDPFAGGGSIPLETLRLGCDTYASDYNPIAVLITKGVIEWPKRYGIDIELCEPLDDDGTQTTLSGSEDQKHKVNLLSYLFEKWARILIDEAAQELEKYYPTESGVGLVGGRELTEEDGWVPMNFIWARTIPCQNPSCEADIPLIRQFWLAKKNSKKIAYKPVADDAEDQLSFEILSGSDLEDEREAGFDPGAGSVNRGNAECLVCGQVTDKVEVRELADNGRMGERLVAVGFHHEDQQGKRYRLAKPEDKENYKDAREKLKEKISEWPYLDSPIPDEDCRGTFASNAQGARYGFEEFGDYFNSRQKLALVTLTDKIKQMYPRVLEDVEEIIETSASREKFDPSDLAQVLMGYLGLLFDRQVIFSSNLARWDNSTEITKHVFGRQALPMVWDYSEVNPFSGSSGSLEVQLYYMLAWIESGTAKLPNEPNVSIETKSAMDTGHPREFFDAVITDPPYYHNVAYGDLSDFFYVWLKRAIGEHFPEIFSTSLTPKDEEIIVDVFREEKDHEFFENQLGESFTEMHRILKSGGVAVFVYAHKTTEGWESMLNALINAGFVVTGSWPIHTEMKARMVAARSAALASSIYMVCRKYEREPIGYWNDVKSGIRENIEEKLEQFWKQGIVGGDFFISAIGPGMEEYSKYEQVEKFSGESVDIDELLEYIRSISTDFLVEHLLRDASSERIDEPAMFYLTYRWTYMDNKVDFDDARKLASAEGVDLSQLWGEGGFVKKTRKYIHVHGPDQRGRVDSIDNMVDAMHRAALLWEKGNQSELGEFLTNSGYGDMPAFWQFCQAVSECLVNGDKEKQLLEGLLMTRDDFTDYVPSSTDTTLEDFADEGGK